MGARMRGRMDVWMHGCMDACECAWMYGWMCIDAYGCAWIYGWMWHEWMDV